MALIALKPRPRPLTLDRLLQMAILFTTEQNEGKSTNQYFECQDFYFCNKHYHELKQSYPFTAEGEMGYNKYRLEKANVKEEQG